VEALYGSALFSGKPVLSTIMSMDLPSYLPRSIPLTLGTRDLVRGAEQMRAAAAFLLEPPINTQLDHPGIDAGRLSADVLTVVIVSRVAASMKQEGIERTIDAVGGIGHRSEIRLLVVGDGSAMGAIQERAARVNESLGREVVVMTGAMNDPRPAYSAADIVVGMGSSVLRGMAFGKPAIVVGERGFTLPVTPDTMATFDRTGFYGIGVGRLPAREDPLASHLGELADNPSRRHQLGEFGRKLVQERYSLDTMAEALDRIYRETGRSVPSLARRATDGFLTGMRVARHKAADRGLPRPARRGTLLTAR
jgi:glycosyltransferase involved in cell wall biosynthesis